MSCLSRPAPSMLAQLKTAWDNRGQGRLLLVFHLLKIMPSHDFIRMVGTLKICVMCRCACLSSASPFLKFPSHWTIIFSSYTSRFIFIAFNNFTRSLLQSTPKAGMRRTSQTSKPSFGFQWWSVRWNARSSANLTFFSVCSHPGSDQSSQAKHPPHRVSQCGQQGLLLHPNRYDKKEVPDLHSLPGLPGGWGGQHCLQVRLPIGNDCYHIPGPCLPNWCPRES